MDNDNRGDRDRDRQRHAHSGIVQRRAEAIERDMPVSLSDAAAFDGTVIRIGATSWRVPNLAIRPMLAVIITGIQTEQHAIKTGRLSPDALAHAQRTVEVGEMLRTFLLVGEMPQSIATRRSPRATTPAADVSGDPWTDEADRRLTQASGGEK